MRALREAGLPNVEILKMATSRAAEVLGMSDTIGTIGPGKVADLVLMYGNPLDDLEGLGSIEMVMKEGRVVYRHSRTTQTRGRAKPRNTVQHCQHVQLPVLGPLARKLDRSVYRRVFGGV